MTIHGGLLVRGLMGTLVVVSLTSLIKSRLGLYKAAKIVAVDYSAFSDR